MITTHLASQDLFTSHQFKMVRVHRGVRCNTALLWKVLVVHEQRHREKEMTIRDQREGRKREKERGVGEDREGGRNEDRPRRGETVPDKGTTWLRK